jgi:hypothetical protein
MGSPNTTPGAVVRVIQIRIKPGHSDAFWADFRQNLKPIYDQERQQGIITSYTVATKVTLNNENDWGVSLRLVYPNWAALDAVAAKTAPIVLAHYGSAAKQSEAAMARTENGATVSSFLVREQTVNPWK